MDNQKDKRIECSQDQQPKQMPLFERAIILAMLVAAFIAEGSLTSYKNFQGTAQNIYADEQMAVNSFKESAEYQTRAEQLRKDLASIAQSTEDKLTRNRKALAAGNGANIQTYSGEIREDSDKSSKLRNDFDLWAAAQIAPIRAQFADKRLRASEKSFVGFVSGVSFSWFVPLLVIALGYLSTRQADQWRWVLLGLSFVPQLLSSQMAYDGALLKFGQQSLALTTGIMFFFCLPPLYHFGIIALRSRKVFCVEEATPVEKKDKLVPTENGKLTHTSTSTILEFPLDEEGYKRVVQLVASEINKGNGKGLFSAALKRFETIGANKATLYRDIKVARSGKAIKRRFKESDS